MLTENITITRITLDELRNLLRFGFQENNLNIDEYIPECVPNEILGVNSYYDLNISSNETIIELVKENLNCLNNSEKTIPRHILSNFLAELTDDIKYDDRACPKTDYVIY